MKQKLVGGVSGLLAGTLPFVMSVPAAAAEETTSTYQLDTSRLVEQAINPGDYACELPVIQAYFDKLLSEFSESELDFLLTSGVLDIAALDAVFFGSASDPAYALEDQARELSHTFRDLQRFWNVESGDIQLLAMHGDMLLDVDRVARVLVAAFGFTEADAAAHAQYIADTIASVPAFDGGDNPIFTSNAFFYFPDKIIMGDGLIDFLEAIGLGDVGPRLILAHEVGHYIQFELGILDSPLREAEATRRIELMADAFATYYAVHARGLALNKHRVLEAQRTFFSGGDCFFDDPLHHGTPQQRMRASAWAATLANNARPQGKILSAATLAALFDAALPELVAPDAGIEHTSSSK